VGLAAVLLIRAWWHGLYGISGVVVGVQQLQIVQDMLLRSAGLLGISWCEAVRRVRSLGDNLAALPCIAYPFVICWHSTACSCVLVAL
jgi:hypothetical protein